MNPYLLDTPATVSFSGGRTSGFMLRKILDAFGGTLPDDVKVCFNNTGLEHPKTYEFVRDVAQRWGCKIHWLEYILVDDKPTFREVDFDTASRNGEPFEALIRKRNFLPNPIARFCTQELKILTTERYAKSLGWDTYTNAVGLRYDEPRRVAKSREREHGGFHSVAHPLYEDQVTVRDVHRFWSSSPFDLGLPWGTNAFGNCVGCFLKGQGLTLNLMREEPEHFAWWLKAETIALNTATTGASFRSDRPTYAQLMDIARTQTTFDFDTYDTLPCACTD